MPSSARSGGLPVAHPEVQPPAKGPKAFGRFCVLYDAVQGRDTIEAGQGSLIIRPSKSHPTINITKLLLQDKPPAAVLDRGDVVLPRHAAARSGTQRHAAARSGTQRHAAGTQRHA